MGDLMQSLGLDPKVILSQILAFAFIYVILSRFLFGPIARMVKARNDEIAERLNSAERHEKAMEQVRDEYEGRIADIERESRDRIQEATREAHEAGVQIVAEARTEREEMIARARQEIRHEKERALVEIRDQVAALVVGGAERIIRRELDDSLHRELVDEYINEVEHVQ